MDPQLRQQALTQWIREIVYRPTPDGSVANLDSLLAAIGTGMDDVLAPYIQAKLEAQQAALQAQLDTITPQVATATAAAVATQTAQQVTKGVASAEQPN